MRRWRSWASPTTAAHPSPASRPDSGPARLLPARRHAQFYYPASAVAGDGQGADGWYDVEADRDRLVGVTMVDLGDV